MIEEYNICKVKEHYYAINEFNEEEHTFLLEDNTEIIITEPSQE